jgi:hypothetical protein
MESLLAEHQQHPTTNYTTTTSRGSRLNNTSGVNITDEDFLELMKQKEAGKKTKRPTKQSKRLATKSKPIQTRKRTNTVGIDTDQENDEPDDSDFEIRHQLDLAIDATRGIGDDD